MAYTPLQYPEYSGSSFEVIEASFAFNIFKSALNIIMRAREFLVPIANERRWFTMGGYLKHLGVEGYKVIDTDMDTNEYSVRLASNSFQLRAESWGENKGVVSICQEGEVILPKHDDINESPVIATLTLKDSAGPKPLSINDRLFAVNGILGAVAASVDEKVTEAQQTNGDGQQKIDAAFDKLFPDI